MQEFDIYWLPHCSTCKKAVAFLEGEKAKLRRFRDLKSDPLSRAEVSILAAMAGGPESLFSRRAIKYRSMKLNERVLSDEEMIDLMANEYTFIKRPVVVSGKKAMAGFSAKRYEAYLNE